MKPSILKNSSYLLIAQIIVKVVAFFYNIYLARVLDVENFGLYTVALSYFALISAISEFGVNRYLTREIALNKSKIPSLLFGVALFRLTTVTVVFASFAVGLSLFDKNSTRVALSLVATLAILPQALALTMDSIYVGLQRLSWSSIGILVLNISTAVVGFLLLRQGYGALGAVSALVVGFLIYIFVLAAFPLKFNRNFFHLRARGQPVVTLVLIKEITKGSLPYGLLAILGLLYFKIDSILLSYIRGSYETGIYGIAYKFLEAVIFIPTALSSAMFPVLARLHTESMIEVKKLYFKSLAFLFTVSLMILGAYVLLLPWLINTYLPQYKLAIPLINILSLTIPFIFIHIPGAVVLLSTDKYLRPVIALSFVALLFNLVLNLIFIPHFGYYGASWITVLSEIFSFGVYFIFLTKRVFK